MTKQFSAPQHLALLNQNQLGDFDHIWAYQGAWFEPPNRERGGWSGVNFLTLKTTAGHQQDVYLKRQQGFTRRTWMHPIVGEPTFLREYNVMQHLQPYEVSTPQTVFFAAKQQEAILMTEALAGYVAWDSWRSAHLEAPNSRKKMVITAIAQMVKKMHQAGVQHRSLYPKHLFVKENNDDGELGVKVAIIDFEKSRITPWITFLKISDLITLNYRTLNLSRTQRLYFLKQYLGVARLTPWQRILCRYIFKRSLTKSTPRL